MLPLRADVLLSNTLFEELEDGISPDFLRHHCGKDNLDEVDFLEMQVDAVSGAQRVECIGKFLPNLQQLRLNQSAVCTIRDLGTSYSHLRVLWLRRSALQDLGGITAMPVLEELYVSFNDVRDLSALYTHDALQILDVEANMIDDFEEIASLQTVATLRELTLNSNPVCKNDDFSREAVLKALPQIELLDDIMRGDDTSDGLKLLELSDEEPGLENLDEFLDPTTSGSDKESQSLLERRCRSPLAMDELLENEGATTEADLSASAAVAEFRKAQAQLRAEATEALASPQKSPIKSPLAEPTEQELIVENVKRSRQPVPNIRSVMSARAAQSDKLYNPFYPDRRGLRTAWSNSGSSTTYRPPSAASGSLSSSAIASSGASAAHSAVDEDQNASDLTMGDDGSVLAGNALSAIRRRRKVAKERGEDEHNIRDMLRKFQTYKQESCLSEAELELRRRASETKRPGTSDVRVSAPRLLTASGRPAPFPSSLPGAPGESWVASSKRPSSRSRSDFVAPTFSTEAGEALIIE
jgi:Leucine-rich repeat (LRR) protein